MINDILDDNLWWRIS